MRAYSSLREIVRGTGALLVEERLNSEAFGSAYAIFSGRGPRFRLVWDGKEGYGLLQAEAPAGEWTDQGPLVREHSGGSFSDMPSFLATAERLVAGAEKT